MAQLNLHISPEFEEALQRFMRLRNIRSKSEAVRLAVREGLARANPIATHTDFHHWVGAGKKLPENTQPRFNSDDDLWG